MNYASAFPAACCGVSEHHKSKLSIDDWLRRAKGSSRLAARRFNQCRGIRSIIAGMVLLGVFSSVRAQMQFPGTPVGPDKHLKAAEVMYVLPPVDPFEVQAGMETNRINHFKSVEFALVRAVDLSPETNGSWHTGNGIRIWQVHILSPDAFSLGLVFNEYRLKPGVKVFVYDPDLHHVKGAFTSGNNKKSGILPVGHLEGQELIVEMQVPDGLSDYGKLRIESVSHAYLDLKALADCGDEPPPGTFGCSQACMIDVNCEEGADWQTEKRSVVRIFTTRQYCSGVLVNNSAYNGTPYILTAEHCINHDFYAGRSVFLFDYESPTCFGEDGRTDRSVAGSELVAVGDSLDFSLVRLSVPPPADYNPYYAGWDRSDNQVSPTVTIHHPWGDVKKITRDAQAPSVPSKPEDVPYIDLNDYHYFSFWWIKRWDLGSTQGGSSGSPLFNSNGQVIGALCGGIAKCGDSIGYDPERDRVIYNNAFNYDDYFTQIRYAWDYNADAGASLRTWLDPDNTGTTSIGGYDPVGTGPFRKETTRQFTLFPNPVRGILQVRSTLPVTGKSSFEIITLSGTVVKRGELDASGESGMDISWMDPGIYLMRITCAGNCEAHKFVIVR